MRDERGEGERGEDERGEDERGEDERGGDERGEGERGEGRREQTHRLTPSVKNRVSFLPFWDIWMAWLPLVVSDSPRSREAVPRPPLDEFS